MKRMIHIAGSMSPSGIGNYIMNVYRHIDRDKVQFDFILCEKRDISFDEEIEALGGRIYYVTRKAVSPIKNFLETKSIISKGRYDTVFRHTDISTVALDLFACALGGAKNRIPHSHSTSTSNIRAHKMFMPMLNAVSTRRFACSDAAGKWLYGDRAAYEVIMNAIDLSDFKYDESVRNGMREKLGIHDDNTGGQTLMNKNILIGHVGNLLPVKNHLFLLDVLKELKKTVPNAKMVFVGDGEMRLPIEDKIKELSLEESVILAGVQNNIPAYLMAMDVFCFPSFYEGLPIALVEAQRAGLPCVISSAVNRDCDAVNELITRLPINFRIGTDPEIPMGTDPEVSTGTDPEIPKVPMGTDPEYGPATAAVLWAKEIIRILSTYERRSPSEEPFVKKGFDINEMVKIYENL